MRYLVQLVIPLLIFLAVLVFATRRHRRSREATGTGDFGMFITILIIGAVAAIGIAWATQWVWGNGA